MIGEVVFSEDVTPVDWSEAQAARSTFGVKAAGCLALPRAWVPQFAAVSANLISRLLASEPMHSVLAPEIVERLRALGEAHGVILVRSSVVGESIWERGTYKTVKVSTTDATFEKELEQAILTVTSSAPAGHAALMVQTFWPASAQGEFGNLQRVSKTRDQWEISTNRDGGISHLRLNSQRDTAADPSQPLLARSGLSQERLFGPLGAWLNNELLRGKSRRLNCEWVRHDRRFYIVQIDEEDEDFWGINPFQLRVPASPKPASGSGRYLRYAEGASLGTWDKLKVLEELWEEASPHKPNLFYLPLDAMPPADATDELQSIENEFEKLIGLSGIIVRTSVRAGMEKITNLPRTECLTSAQAVKWCLDVAAMLSKAGHNLGNLAFVAHRFVAARASAWVRATPGEPVVEIHSLWGLPDALQYCPYDIWEVHVPASVATDYPDYKSDVLIARDDGSWEHARVKNELARSNSITSAEARDIAARSLQIAEKLGRACHIMWFVGCIDEDSATFNLPWYWTEAHEAERNHDRASYRTFTVTDRESLKRFVGWEGSRQRQALSLKPTDLNLMRDTAFIRDVGEAASAANVPVILSGSTLAHAYYQLRMLGCTVVTPSEKERSRVRRTANLGKLVRDKIPTRIADRQEIGLTRQLPIKLIKGFLISKLLEEALEVRAANAGEQTEEELADLFEVFRAMAKSEGVSLSTVQKVATEKRDKAGGFEQGLVLLQTSLPSPDKGSLEADRASGQFLGHRTSDDTIELPFTFFGFMEFDQPRSILFAQLGVRVDVTLRPDRLEVRLVRASEQLGLALDEDLEIAGDEGVSQ